MADTGVMETTSVHHGAGLRGFETYPEYKNSGIPSCGHVPAHWTIQRAKLVLRELDDRSNAGDETLLSVSEYRGVTPRSEMIEEGDFLTRAESLEGYRRCRTGDLVMNIMLAWKTGLGFARCDGIVSPAYSVFRFQDPDAVPAYFDYLLRSREYVSEFRRWSYGIVDSRLRLYPEIFLRLPLLKPPPAEQTAIGAFLDRETAKIDALVAKKEGLVDLLHEKRAALITRVVTKGLNANVTVKDSGVEWLGEIPAHWEVKPVRWVLSVRSGEALPNTEFELTESEERVVPVIGGNGVMGYTNRSNTGVQSIAVGRVGALCGNVHLVTPPAWVTDNALLLSHIQGYDRRYLALLLEALDLNRWASQNAQPLITGTFLKEQRVCRPPLPEQQHIVKRVRAETEAMDALVLRVRDAIERLKELRTALISAAVTGKIDVRDQAV
jgi:type I restriction enzyme S subunit